MSDADLDLKGAIARVVAGHDLSGAEIAAVFGAIMDGAATPAQIGGLLIGLRCKGETAEEIAGAARAMRARAVPLRCPEPERGVDTCGTGGDGAGTVNVSTLAAIVVAAAGGCVVKHGNRAQSSRAGSADVLEVLGVAIDGEPPAVERCLRDARIGFAFAPKFHAATRHAGGPRRELGTRTIFNLLGPLTNPAQVLHQVVGVFDRRWCEPVAAALGLLGARRAFVVHGAAGLDEVEVRGPTCVAEWTRDDGGGGGAVVTRELSPADFGLEEVDPAGLAGGDATDNARILRRVLAAEDVEPGEPLRAVFNAAVMEAALALVAIGLDDALPAAATRASQAIWDLDAQRTLARWAEVSHARAGGRPT
ncbi:MAG: anthranilate phosphoribosyltransferase [Kofleriaceae bacterium]|nr:anthranilate phosphoribosyltransferase [Kofleriaceae bacterium]MCB9572889.1 anthranilate phosphoribosyltransferase [Kofleriaceae bacterium]